MSEYFVVRRGATALRNEVVFDERISYAALGILARALASPEGANLGYRAFVGRGLGEKAVRAAMRELEAVGYRFRFTLRKSSGRVRTLTIFSDEPMTPQQARVVALEQSRGDYLVEGAASPDPEPTGEGERLRRSHRAAPVAARPDGRASHRAATGAARSDQGKQGKTAGRTVQRSTAARSSAALSLRDNKSSKEDLTLPHPHPPQEREGPAAPSADPGSGPVGSGTDPEDQEVAAVIAASPLATTAPSAGPGPSVARPAGAGAGEGWPWEAVPAPVDPRPDPTRTQDPVGRSAAQAADTAPRRPSERLSGQQASSVRSGVRKARRGSSGESSARSADSERDRELIGMCLPPWQWAMDTPGARKVAAMLAERVTAGWRPGEIRARMVGDPPKDGVRHMAAFVAARLRTNVDPGYAPVLMGAAAQEAGERRAAERREATERAREAARTPEERAWDAAYAEAWAEAQSGLVGSSRLEVAEWAAERARAALAAGAGAAAS